MNNEPSEALRVLLAQMREHAGFPDLLQYLKPAEPVTRYVPRKDEDVEKTRSNWIYLSGKWLQYDLTYAKLTGTAPPQGG